ncbi:MAG: hemerythrin [Xanthomonadales bacterium]|nr:hemerythrin [Xanthomonadales bacterium]|tara:strand:- start:92 stop:679 length:588 start_codon:yes stop_codon:yes gene_type:complete
MTDCQPVLHLENRSGLSDDIAVLRARYPRSAWSGHRNYGELAAFWRSVHDGLRREGAALADLTAAFRAGQLEPGLFQRRFMPQLAHHLRHLEGHHRIEDDQYFPRFRRLDRRFARGFDVLENDHDVIHDEVLRVADSGRALLHELSRHPDARQRAAERYADDAECLLHLLDRHLFDEEDLVIPAMLEHGERPLIG